MLKELTYYRGRKNKTNPSLFPQMNAVVAQNGCNLFIRWTELNQLNIYLHQLFCLRNIKLLILIVRHVVTPRIYHDEVINTKLCIMDPRI